MEHEIKEFLRSNLERGGALVLESSEWTVELSWARVQPYLRQAHVSSLHFKNTSWQYIRSLSL